MSGQQTTVDPLTDRQRAWANAFLKVMGGTGTVTAPKKPNAPPDDLKGDLAGMDTTTNQSMKQQRDVFAGLGEDITRKKTIGRSSDKGFKKSVSDPVNKILVAVDKLIASDQIVDERTLPELKGLVSDLTEQRQHYMDGLSGEKNKDKRAQRQLKIDAITKRLDALDRLEQASKVAQSDRTNAVGEMTVKDRAALLDQNPEIRKAVIAGKPAPKDLAALLSELSFNNAEPALKLLLDEHGDDEDYIAVVTEAMIDVAVKKSTTVGEFFRNNSAGPKMTTLVAKQDTVLIDKARQNSLAAVKDQPPIEIDPLKITDPEHDLQDSIDRLLQVVDGILDGIVGKPVARCVSTTASMIASGARAKGMGEEDVMIMVGGHVVLRVVCPAIVLANPPSPAAKRSLLLASKVIQNMSNGTTPTDKEAFMVPLVEATEDRMPAMHQWFAEIATQGDIDRGIPPDPDRKQVLIDFLNGDLDYDSFFAEPSDEDPFGTLPARPEHWTAPLLTTARAEKPTPTGVSVDSSPSFLKLVQRERAALIKRAVARLEAHNAP